MEILSRVSDIWFITQERDFFEAMHIEENKESLESGNRRGQRQNLF